MQTEELKMHDQWRQPTIYLIAALQIKGKNMLEIWQDEGWCTRLWTPDGKIRMILNLSHLKAVYSYWDTFIAKRVLWKIQNCSNDSHGKARKELIIDVTDGGKKLTLRKNGGCGFEQATRSRNMHNSSIMMGLDYVCSLYMISNYDDSERFMADAKIGDERCDRAKESDDLNVRVYIYSQRKSQNKVIWSKLKRVLTEVLLSRTNYDEILDGTNGIANFQKIKDRGLKWHFMKGCKCKYRMANMICCNFGHKTVRSNYSLFVS